MESGIITEKDKIAAAPLLAASSYLNTAPLIWSFLHGRAQREVEILTHEAPARCASLLAKGTVDAALVPVIEYQRIPEILLVPHVCVGSRERVRSVVLVTKNLELSEVRSVSLDTSSRTSAALIQVLFREFIGREPEWKQAEPDLQAMLGAADAALIIGDPAMTFPREDVRVYDMAALWREHTGLGFVFAVWMAREGVVEKARRVNFVEARDEGLAHVEEIVARYEEKLKLSRTELREYLLDNICFELDEEMLAGLDLFYHLAAKHGITSERRPLKWMGASG